MFCTKCGNQLSETAKFCPVCGTPAERDEIPEASEVQSPVAEKEVTPGVQEVQSPAAEKEVIPGVPEVTIPFIEGKAISDIPDVTIPATKWIPENEQLSIPPQKKKKKGKIALIISLSSVAVLIGVAIGLAFMFSSKFSDKVEELEKFEYSTIVNGFRSEYDDLLLRARENTDVIHVFGTFSLGSEIDAILERISAEQKKLPEAALSEVRGLEDLGNTYFIDEWGAQIYEYENRIRQYIDNGSYELLAVATEECKELKSEIISKNTEYKNQLEDVKNKVIDMRTSCASYSEFESEADDYIESVMTVMSSGNMRDIPYYINMGYNLISRIEEANHPYLEIADRKEYYDGLFNDVEVFDLDRLDQCLLGYSDALSGGSDLDVLEEIVSEYAAFYEETHEENLAHLQKYLEKIEVFDTSKLAPEELVIFNDELTLLRECEGTDKLRSALEHAYNCMNFVDLYTPKITDCEKFIAMATNLASDYFMYCGYNYSGELTEEQMYYICEYVLTDELKQQLRDELGWGKMDPKEEEELKMIEAEYGYNPWSCGFTREECEELAYYITGNKHYFYKDIKDCSGGYVEYGNTGITRTGEIEVVENEDGSLSLGYDIQVFLDGLIYSARISITTVANEDSFFDGYSVVGIDLTDAEEINYKEQYLKALQLLYDNEPDQYDDGSYSRRISMVYVNNDYIPELYVSGVFGYASAYLITYDSETGEYIISGLESGDGFSEYITGEGVIRICDGRQGYYYDVVISVDAGGNVKTEFSGEYYYINNDTDEMEYKITYPETMDNVESSVFYEYLDQYYTSKGPSSNLTGDYTYSMMTQMLAD